MAPITSPLMYWESSVARNTYSGASELARLMHRRPASSTSRRVRGAYFELDRPHRVVLSWGHAGSDRLPPGASTVEVTLAPTDGGTFVTIVHTGLPEPDAAAHATGWPHFLDRLALAGSGGDPGPDPWLSDVSST